MKKGARLIAFTAGCMVLVAMSLYAGRNAHRNCDRCNFNYQTNQQQFVKLPVNSACAH